MKLFIAIAYSALTLCLSVLPKSTAKKILIFEILHIDKIAHFGLYFIFFMVWFQYFNHSKYKAKAAINAFLLSAAFGVLMEIIQRMLLTGRTFQLWDIVANILGALAGVIIAKRIQF